jgi:hypothetical protein
MSSSRDRISIIDADPDLAELLEPAQRERARREAIAGVRFLSVGDWDAAGAIEPDVHHRSSWTDYSAARWT